MQTESIVHLPFGLAMFQEFFHSPDGATLAKTILRWGHFVAGITWIGLLYFFNLVNVPLMKALDGPTKSKVIPELLPRALWWFRWGAVVTVLVGFTYYAMYILKTDVNNANTLGNAGANVWLILIVWLLIPVITFAIEFFIIQKNVINDGRVLAVVIAILVILMAVAILYWLDSSLVGNGGRDHYASNKTFSIGIGGAMGLIMLLNVWGIIWPSQKRIIAGTISGTAAPPELARRAFLASRANAWLSLPMLFFMATSHDWIIFGK